MKSCLIEKGPDAGKDGRQKEKEEAKDERVSITDNEYEFQQTLGDSGGQRSLAFCSPWGHKELNTT